MAKKGRFDFCTEYRKETEFTLQKFSFMYQNLSNILTKDLSYIKRNLNQFELFENILSFLKKRTGIPD